MSYEKEIQQLKQFNALVERLDEGRFAEYLKTKKVGVRMQFDNRSKSGHIHESFPDKEALDSAILKIRLFRDDKDGVSLRKIGDIYSQIPVDKKLKSDFDRLRSEFNKYLDSDSMIVHVNKPVTNREIFEVMMFGRYAHVNEDKVKKLEEWIKHPMEETLYTFEFITVLQSFYTMAKAVSYLNRQIIDLFLKE